MPRPTTESIIQGLHDFLKAFDDAPIYITQAIERLEELESQVQDLEDTITAMENEIRE